MLSRQLATRNEVFNCSSLLRSMHFDFSVFKRAPTKGKTARLKGSHVIIRHLRKALTQHQKLVNAKRLSLPASKLSIWGSREMSRESRTRKKTPVRGAGKERESSPFPPPLAASLLACSLARSHSLAASFVRYNWRSCSQAGFFFEFEKGKICTTLTG